MSERFRSIAAAEICLFDTATFADDTAIAFGVAVTFSEPFVLIVTKFAGAAPPAGETIATEISMLPARLPVASVIDAVFVVPVGNGPVITVDPRLREAFVTLIVM